MRWSHWLLPLCLVAVAPAVSAAPRAAKVHVVYGGQRLGSIAKRYNVTVDALCNANGIDKNDPIHPGQKLVVPPRGDRDGSQTRASNPELAGKKSREPAPQKRAEPAKAAVAGRTHKVASGQRLGSIAKRYNVTVDALCKANGIKQTDLLRLGQLLTVPDPSDREPELKNAEVPLPKGTKPRRAGYLELYTYTARWRGQVVDRKGRMSSAAVTAISKLLGATGDKPRLDRRLIRLLVQASDAFGGRPIRVVSGYRTASYYDDSRHRLSRAIDFSIPGVPNTTLRDYLRRFSNAGVGYYPNSSFVHLDVREGSAYWVDYAGPGEAPRKTPRKTAAHDDHTHGSEPGSGPPAGETQPAGTDSAADTRPASLIKQRSEPSKSKLPPLM
jgi:uncharacterized protein YcbK (DUF882 family)